LLTGVLAAAFIRGAQSQGVATTVKHFVGNDAETERLTMSSVIDERTLRELYLLPFEAAVREGGSLGIMTGYNRVNGTWCAEHGPLLSTLREEWGFEGFVVTDWFSVASPVASSAAGLDLEMPGPGRAYGPALADAVRAGDVDEATVDAMLTRLLSVYERIGALDDTGDEVPTSVDAPEDRALTREAAAASIVLLTNDGVLPLNPAALTTVAVIGPNADRAVIMGGGSARVMPAYETTPLGALRARLGDGVEVVHEPGVDITRTAPVLSVDLAYEYRAGPDGPDAGAVVKTEQRGSAELFSFGPPPDVPADYRLRATGTYLPQASGAFEVTLIQAGGVRLTVDGAVVLDGIADPPPRGRSFFGGGSQQVTATIDLEAGRPVEVEIDFEPSGPGGIDAFKIGGRTLLPDDAVARAVAAAGAADVAVVVVGTDHEWESEGADRGSWDLPGEQLELIEQVCAANARTVVLVNAGSPVDLTWVDAPAAVAQVWFGGQEMGAAIAEMLLGDTDPGGRLPTTQPLAIEHNPSFGNFPGESDEARYGEGLLMGYRWYEARRLPVRFPFGHGLSYATFEIGEPALSATTFTVGGTLTVDVPVTNTGDRRGSEVVQCYVEPVEPRVVRPVKELKAFAKVPLDPGESATVTFTLDDRAFAYWDVGTRDGPEIHERMPMGGSPAADAARRDAGWRVDPGAFTLHIGRSSADIAHVVPAEVVA
jgi:beta-glucosidase